MVHVSAPAVESIPNDSYSIHVIIMIVGTSCIQFPANIWVASRCKTAFGNMFMYGIYLFMLNLFRIVKLDDNNLVIRVYVHIYVTNNKHIFLNKPTLM